MDYSPKHKLLIIASAVFLVIGFKTFVSLGQSSYANGWDSYFYLIQAKSWLAEGAMHSPSASLIHPYLTFAMLCGLGEDIIAYKIAIACLAGLFSFFSILIANKWSKSTEVVLIVGSLLIISPFIDYFAAQYPKNLLGLVFFVAFILSVSTERIVIPLLLLVLNFFGHKLTFGMALIFFVTYYAPILLNRKVIIAGIIAAVSLVLSGLFIPGLLSIADTERISKIFSISPTWSSFEFIQFLTLEHISTWWMTLIILLDLLFLFSLGWWGYSKTKGHTTSRYSLPLILLGLLFFCPFLRWSDDGLALRMYLSFAMIFPLLASFLPTKYKYPLIPAAIFIISILTALNTNGYSHKQHDPPYDTYKNITNRLIEIDDFKTSELIIGHKSLAEYITFETGKDVLPWQPEYKVAEDKLWRIVTNIIAGDLRFYIPDGKYYKLSANYYFVNEADWQQVLKKAKLKGDNQFLESVNTWRNPHQIRPNYLLRNKSK